jgi:sulfur carrier protein ThiS
MHITFHGRDHNCTVEVDEGSSIRQTLEEAGILPSTVVVSFEDRILPHSTILNSDVKLLVTTVSSGG